MAEEMKQMTCMLVSLALCGPVFAQDVSRDLALKLAGENPAASALEFRRAAMESDDAAARGAYAWASAWQYWQAKNFKQALVMLDEAEEHAAPEAASPVMALRAEASAAMNNPAEAVFYYESAAQGGADAARWASRKLAGLRIREGDLSAARGILTRSGEPDAAVMAAVEKYAAGKDKSPRLGGLLGLIPGLGYAYSGEWANAARSLILNGLFIYGMADTAGDEEWGAFSIITFFELTWYSGSIYGGVDSAHRFNESRLDECLDAVSRSAEMSADLDTLPLISLRFEF